MNQLLRLFRMIYQASKGLLSWIATHPWSVAILTIIVMYGRLPWTFFAQDEWLIFGEHLIHEDDPISRCFAIQRPLTCFLNSIETRFFGLTIWPYALLSIGLTIACSLVLYRLLRNWQFSPWQAALAASFFPVISAGSQAIAWFGAFSASLPSYLFALLCLYFVQKEVEQPSTRNLLLLFGCAILSFYFKEESLWLGLMIPVTWLLYSQTIHRPLTWRRASIILIPVIILFSLFLYGEFIRQTHNPAFKPLFVHERATNTFIIDSFRTAIALPVYHLSHLLVPPSQIVVISQRFPISIGLLSYVLTSLLLIGVSSFFRNTAQLEKQEKISLEERQQHQANQRLIIWLTTWIFISYLAYAIRGEANVATLESRYYFPSQAGMAGLLVLLLAPRPPFRKKISLKQAVALYFLVAIIWLNVSDLWLGMRGAVATAKERKKVIHFITHTTGPLPNRAIIFTDDKAPSLGGAIVPTLPFQTGPGYMFQIIFHRHNQDYRPLIKQFWLWEIYQEGYDEKDGVGFGYFRNYDQLAQAVREKTIPIDHVYGFRYQKQEISDITSQVRQALAKQATDWH